jgi:hypothetical protein
METKDRLEIKMTNSTPEVVFETDGNLKFKGRIMTENPLFFQPIMDWVDKLDCKIVKLDINLEYLNTSASMQLFQMLKNISDNCLIESIDVIWHYESDDEDHLETGQVYEEKLKRIKFRFMSYV